MSFPLWAERLYNSPLALDRMTNETLCEFAQQRICGNVPDKMDATTLAAPQMRASADEATYHSESGRKAFRSRGSIAVVPVRGKLVQRGGWVDAESGLIGYNTILNQVKAATNDPEINGTFMPFDTGGGETAGMFAMVEELASLSAAEGGKPIYAYLDEKACSAGYIMASACDKIYGRRECMGGSIAALMNVIDKSKALEKMGIEPHIIRAKWADLKARGSGIEPIDPETLDRLGAIVDEISEQIVEFVAAMRGIKPQSIRDMRGDVFTGTALLKHGLIDDILSEREAWAALEEAARSN